MSMLYLLSLVIQQHKATYNNVIRNLYSFNHHDQIRKRECFLDHIMIFWNIGSRRRKVFTFTFLNSFNIFVGKCIKCLNSYRTFRTKYENGIVYCTELQTLVSFNRGDISLNVPYNVIRLIRYNTYTADSINTRLCRIWVRLP